MSSYNKVTMMGYITREPQLRYTPNQTPVVDFSLATNRKWRTAGGEEREEVCFVQCFMFGKRATVIREHFGKGSPILIEGRLVFEQWTGPEGEKRSCHKVAIEDFKFLPAGKRNKPAEDQDADPNDIPEEEIPF